MKYQNIFVYTILAIGILSIPSLLDNVQAQTNATNQTSAGQNQTSAGQNQTSAGQNQTMSEDPLSLMLEYLYS